MYAQDKEFIDNPVFIVGAARSGTTLLQYMLRSNPELSFPTAESHFIIPFHKFRNKFGDLSQQDNLIFLLEEIYKFRKPFFDDDVHGLDFNPAALAEEFHKAGIQNISGVISAIFRKNAQGEGKKRWGDKTPYYVFHMETLLEMFPNAQFIHLIRDGRDCALSMLERKWHLQIFNIYHTACTWDRYVTAGKMFGDLFPEHYIELRYEDLLTHPEKSLKILCAFLNIEFSESVINYEKSDFPGKTPLIQEPLKKTNQGKWKQQLSKRQISIFEAVAGDTLKECNYEIYFPNTSINTASLFYYKLHIWLCQIKRKYFVKRSRPVRTTDSIKKLNKRS